MACPGMLTGKPGQHAHTERQVARTAQQLTDASTAKHPWRPSASFAFTSLALTCFIHHSNSSKDCGITQLSLRHVPAPSVGAPDRCVVHTRCRPNWLQRRLQAVPASSVLAAEAFHHTLGPSLEFAFGVGTCMMCNLVFLFIGLGLLAINATTLIV